MNMPNNGSQSLLENFTNKATWWIGTPQSFVVHTCTFTASLLIIPTLGLQTWLLVLTTVVSIEAIYLSIFIQMAVNSQKKHLKRLKEVTREVASDVDDILEDTEMIGPSAIRGRRLNKATILGRRLNDKGKREDYNKEIPITQCLEVRATNRDKSNCLTTVAKDNVLTTMPIGRHPDAFKNNLPFRYYTIKEYCRLQTVPENYFDGVASENQIRKMIGNGWNVDTIAHIFGGLS
jgi:site-specific DNA-cytosine methylase